MPFLSDFTVFSDESALSARQKELLISALVFLYNNDFAYVDFRAQNFLTNEQDTELRIVDYDDMLVSDEGEELKDVYSQFVASVDGEEGSNFLISVADAVRDTLLQLS